MTDLLALSLIENNRQTRRRDLMKEDSTILRARCKQGVLLVPAEARHRSSVSLSTRQHTEHTAPTHLQCTQYSCREAHCEACLSVLARESERAI